MAFALNSAWLPAAGVTTFTLAVCAVYGRGIWRRRKRALRDSHGRQHVLFIAGVLLVFLSLESPLDSLAEHLFFVHQIQHLILLSVTPMLITLAAPQATLFAGLGGPSGHGIVRPVLASRALNGIGRLLTHPVAATVLFAGALYFWQVPRFHDAAVLHEEIHYAMHGTMLAAGLIFWWCVLGHWPPSTERSYLCRLLMLKVSLMMSVFLGVYLTAKNMVLYDVYDHRYGGGALTALSDEMAGGAVLWLGGGALLIAGAVIVARRWRRQAIGVRAGTP